ncbi:MAG: BCSC C-terminal domain-containing protein [Vampirovibrio sp.]|nr:BCSC C-terminal domain-containing protein [Vampirovibrio sp.]
MNPKASSTLFLNALLAVTIGISATQIPQALAAAPSALNYGINLYNKGMIGQALPVFKKATAQNPTNAGAYAWLGKAYKKQGGAKNQALAMSAYKKALQLNPNQPDALKDLAELYSWKSETRSHAVKLYSQYLANNPNDKLATKQLAQLYIWQGKYAQATPLVNRVYGSYQYDRAFMAAVAQLYTYTGRAEEAVDLYESRLNAQASGAVLSLRQNYVAALVKAKQYDKARELYHNLLESVNGEWASMDNEVLNAVSGMAFELGDYKTTIKIDSTLLGKSDVDSTLVGTRLARAYAKTKEYYQATQIMDGLHQRGLLDTANLVEYGDLLMDARLAGANVDFQKIESLYREAIKRGDDKTGVALRLARVYADTPGRFDDAVNFFTYSAERDASGKAKKELVDFLKSSATKPDADARAGFANVMQSFPNDATVLGGYAEYLSWNEATRDESLQAFLQLAQANSSQAQAYTEKLDDVLAWHQAKRRNTALYNELAAAYPESKGARLAEARAFWQDKSTTPDYERAFALYQELAPAYENDTRFTLEYAQMLSSVSDRRLRNKAISMIETLAASNPEDAEIKLAYARMLASAGKSSQAIKAFDAILATTPNSKEALLGKGQAYLWSGNPFTAKKYLLEAKAQFPNDAEVNATLAEAYKAMGRYDKALNLIQEGRAMGNTPAGEMPIPTHTLPAEEEEIEVDSHHTSFLSLPKADALLNANTEEAQGYADTIWDEEETTTVAPPQVTPVAPTHVASAASDSDDFDRAMQALKAMQSDTEKQVKALEDKVDVMQDLAPGQAEVSTVVRNKYATPQQDELLNGQPTVGAEAGYAQRIIADEDPAVGNQIGARGDLHYLDKLAGIENEVSQLMRPTFRTGFLYSTQKGDKSTNALRQWAFPNQVSFMLTPTVRLRGGYALRRFSTPKINGSNIATTAHQYSGGLTWQLADRLLFDGDGSFTEFTQSKTSNFTYQARLQFQAHDKVKLQAGMRRSPFETSFLSYAGVKPSQGLLANQLVGQVRENSVFGEINLGPWHNFDANMGYDFAWIDGENVPDNTKNQAFGNLGYNWQYTKNHAARLAYETLFFGFAKQATNGYYDLSGTLNGPVSTMLPPTAAIAGTVLGGYFSPSSFFLNDVRLDLRGNFMDRLLEYKAYGSIGVQHFNGGLPGEKSPTSAAYNVGGQLTANITDSISLYGLADYLSTGGIFDRLRVGGGLIYRPDFHPLMPMFGNKVSSAN